MTTTGLFRSGSVRADRSVSEGTEMTSVFSLQLKASPMSTDDFEKATTLALLQRCGPAGASLDESGSGPGRRSAQPVPAAA
jgi:hypothetical protein